MAMAVPRSATRVDEDEVDAKIKERKVATSPERQNHYKWGNERLDANFDGDVSVKRKNFQVFSFMMS
jgi:hypothetical protein